MPNRINHNLPMNSANQNVQQTHLLTKANTKHDAIQSASESTNTKLDQFSGAINNAAIGDGTVKLQTYCYGHDVANGQARALKVDANGRLECNVADIELHTGDIALSVDGLETLIGTTNTKLQSDLDFAGQPNSIGDGQNMKRTMNYGHDSAAGQMRPLKVDADGHLQVDILSSAAPAGTATEATLAAAEAHLGNVETAVQLMDDVVTAQNAAHPSKANAVGGRYYTDNTFRDIRVDNIGKVIVDSPAGSDINLRIDAISNGQTQNGDGTGNKPGVMLDAVNTNIISLNNKFVGGQTTSGMATAANQQVVDLTLQGIDTVLGDIQNAQTQNGDGTGNKPGVMLDAINTNTITGNGKIDTTNSRLGTINTSIGSVDTSLGTVITQFRGQTQDGNGGGNKLGVMIDAINTNTITQNGKIDTSNTNLSNISSAYGSNKCNINISSDAVGLATQTTAAVIAGDTTSIDGKITACNTGAVVLAAGSAAIGKLAANSGVDIGDVDVTSISAGSNRIGMVGIKANEAADGSGTERHLLCDTAGHLQVDVISAPTTTVSGTVTANLSATDNAVLDVIAGDTTSIDGKITACNTGAVVLAAGSAAIGKLAANSGVDIGDVDVTSISAGSNRIGMVAIKANEAADGSGTERHLLCDTAGHLQVDILSSALPSGAAGEISNAAIASAAGNILTKSTLATSAEIKELLSGVTVNQATLSAELDTEHYDKIRLFGETSASVGSDIKVFGSNVSGGTYYFLNNSDLQAQTLTVSGLGSVHYVGAQLDNTPRYIKIFNNSGSTNYTFTKLYMVGSGGRVAV